MTQRSKVLMVGWDGATFDIIEPLVAAGRLPNVASLLKNGAWGRMESTIPALTPTAWTSMSTGVNPGKHGIFDAILFNMETKKNIFINTSLRRSAPLWSILSERGRQVGIVNVPATYPPDAVNGSFISGMFTPEGARDLMYPAELHAEITGKFGPYMIECRKSDSPEAYLKSILNVEVAYREQVASYLMERNDWDLFFCVFAASDRVQHFFWKYLDPSHPDHREFGDSIAKVYEKMDESLGRLIAKAGEDTTVVMVSDHGAGPLRTAFFLNLWLQQNGYLFLNEEFSSMLKRRSRIVHRVVNRVKRMLGVGRQGSGVTDADKDAINRFPARIDWDRTIAFSEGVGGGIFINSRTVPPERYQETVDAIISRLLAIRDAEGKPVIKTMHRRDEIYHGESAHQAPDLLVICEAGFQIIGPNEMLFFKNDFANNLFLSHRWSGRHEHDGIFIMKGPSTGKNRQLKECNIMDVAPTVLYVLDETVPNYMDGKVLTESQDERYLAEHPVRHSSEGAAASAAAATLSKEEDAQISEKLRELGYLE